jgi:Ca2+-binding EF-hand superfamily protein
LILGIYLLNQNLFVKQPDTLEELRAGFNYFDYNGDGFITYEDAELADEALS